MKPFKTNISQGIKEEWMMKEEGSYEDHGRPESGHVYCILCDSPKGKIVCNTEEELKMLEASAEYQTSWDSDDEEVIKLVRSAARICREIREHNLS